MKLKTLLTSLALALSLGGCGENAGTGQNVSKDAQAAMIKPAEQQHFEWKLVTSWPKNYPGLGTAPERFAKQVEEMSGGRLTIKVYGAGEMVPGFEVFDAVSAGTAEMGHSGAYYWKGKIPAAQLFSAIPFGMNAQEMNGWLHYGGGQELWQALYEPYNLLPFAGGNSGVQMAGWFKKEINSVDDLKGLKMRIPGLGGEVLKELGGVPVALTGGELFTALQTGAIDATEWVGPYNDLAFGLNRAAEFYYYSGWHEPGTTLEYMINKDAFNTLPADLKAIVRIAMRASNADMLDEYTARNNAALQTLTDKHNVKMRAFPDDVMKALKQATQTVLERQVAADPDFAKVYASYSAFMKDVRQYHEYSEKAYYLNR